MKLSETVWYMNSDLVSSFLIEWNREEPVQAEFWLQLVTVSTLLQAAAVMIITHLIAHCTDVGQTPQLGAAVVRRQSMSSTDRGLGVLIATSSWPHVQVSLGRSLRFLAAIKSEPCVHPAGLDGWKGCINISIWPRIIMVLVLDLCKQGQMFIFKWVSWQVKADIWEELERLERAWKNWNSLVSCQASWRDPPEVKWRQLAISAHLIFMYFLSQV